MGAKKLAWLAGDPITPQHFQQQDNYHEEMLRLRSRSISHYDWGLQTLKINNEAIKNGIIDIMELSGFLPDGTHINVPSIPAPPQRSIKNDLVATQDRLGLYIAIPAQRAGQAQFDLNRQATDLLTRYACGSLIVKDIVTGDNELTIPYAHANFRLLFANENLDGYSTIQIAQVERTASGQFTLSDQFIPPLLDIKASAWLSNTLTQLIEIAVAKRNSLTDRRQKSSTQADFTTSDVLRFWLLHTLNAAIPVLNHLQWTDGVHPETLYTEMISLAGSLTTFVFDTDLNQIPKYQHDDLYYTFSSLDKLLRHLLETVIPTNWVAIPLNNVRQSLYTGTIADQQLIKDASFYIGLRAQIPDNRLMASVPKYMKISSKEDIEDLIGPSIPGVEVIHTSTPPSSMPLKLGYQYYRLDKQSPYWRGVQASSTIAVYLPADEFPDLKLEMIAVKS